MRYLNKEIPPVLPVHTIFSKKQNGYICWKEWKFITTSPTVTGKIINKPMGWCDAAQGQVELPLPSLCDIPLIPQQLTSHFIFLLFKE